MITLNQVFKSNDERINGYTSELRDERNHYFIFEFTLKNKGDEDSSLNYLLEHITMDGSISVEILDGTRALKIFDEEVDNEEMIGVGEVMELTYLYLSDASEGNWSFGDIDSPSLMTTQFF